MSRGKLRLSEAGAELVKFVVAGLVAIGVGIGAGLISEDDGSDLTCDHIVPGAGGAVEVIEDPLRREAVERCYIDLLEKLNDD